MIEGRERSGKVKGVFDPNFYKANSTCLSNPRRFTFSFKKNNVNPLGSPQVGIIMRDSEVEKIQKSLDTFVEGLRILDYDKISAVFFEKGMSCGAGKEEIMHVYRDHWKEMREQAEAAGKDYISATATYTIRSLTIVGNAASVIIDLTFGTEDEITEQYIDFYHMVKVKDRWFIVNKIFPTNIERENVEKS